MIILFNDQIQNSDAPSSLKTAALSDSYNISGPVVITFTDPVLISSIGIGNTDGKNFTITFNDIENTVIEIIYSGSGLYPINKTIKATHISIDTDALYIGRIGAGIGVSIPTSIAKEPGWNSTSMPRTTLSGQVIPGAGGYNYRTLSLDSRYKMGKPELDEIQTGYKTTAAGYPFFIDLTDECYKIPYSKLYATEKNQRQLVFESGVRRFLYSRRFEFQEAF
jgi:hypothetical protein